MTFSKSDRIAICGEHFPRDLKHRLLFFDRIGFNNPEDRIGGLRLFRSEDLNRLADDIEFLSSKNILFDAAPFISESKAADNRSKYVGPEDEADLRSAELVDQQRSKLAKRFEKVQEKSLTSLFSRSIKLGDALAQFDARICARYLQHSKGREASAVLSRPLSIPNKMKRIYDELHRPSTDILEVVLDKLPMPSELTPWEAILDFKADSEAQGYLQGLKVWMGDVARQKLTATEAREKLEWLLFQHKKHLKAHKLAYRWGTLGGTFVATAEILEDLVKFKCIKAVGAVVSIVDKRLELMKAELSNPAKEVSYIVKAQERFEG
jgi:DNA-binding transcriptional MerR regulator